MAEILIYDEILSPEWAGWGGITAASVVAQLAALEGDVLVRINSPGGMITEGLTIYQALMDARRKGRKVVCQVDGLAASMASVIACAGDRTVIAATGLFMVHNPSGVALGTAEDMREHAELLDTMRGQLCVAYKEKTGLGDEALHALMDAESWLTPEAAKKLGFVDEILAAPPRKEQDEARARWDLARYRWQHAPQAVYARWGKPRAAAPPAPAPPPPPPPSSAKRTKSMADSKRIRAALTAFSGLLALATEAQSSDQPREQEIFSKVAEAIPPMAGELQQLLQELDPDAAKEHASAASLKDLFALGEEVSRLAGVKTGLVGAVRAMHQNALAGAQATERQEVAAIVEQMIKDRQILPADRAHYQGYTLDDARAAAKVLRKKPLPGEAPAEGEIAPGAPQSKTDDAEVDDLVKQMRRA